MKRFINNCQFENIANIHTPIVNAKTRKKEFDFRRNFNFPNTIDIQSLSNKKVFLKQSTLNLQNIIKENKKRKGSK